VLNLRLLVIGYPPRVGGVHCPRGGVSGVEVEREELKSVCERDIVECGQVYVTVCRGLLRCSREIKKTTK